MQRFYITETENGFVLKIEWDCTEGGMDDTTLVFESSDGDMLDAFEKMVKRIRKGFED